MKLTKRQLRKIIKEEKDRLTESYNSMSPRGRALANAAKRRFAKDYPDVQVGIDGREGWITVNGRKAVNMSQASGSPLSMDDIIDRMKQAYLGHDMSSRDFPEAKPGPRPGEHQLDFGKDIGTYIYQNEGTAMKITKNQLKKLIAEEKQKLLVEMNPMANAERSLGLYADVRDVEALQGALLNILQGVEMEAQQDGLEDDEAEDYAADAAVLAVAQAFQSAGLVAQYDALLRTLR